MVMVKGFRGIRYNPNEIESFDDVLAPPYDVISPTQQDDFYDKDPLNVIRLVLAKGEGDSRYESAAATYNEWQESGVLLRDQGECIYPYYQEFEENGTKILRKGFIAVVKIEDFSTKQILPHELTFPKHKRDRLKLTTACNSNMSPIFCVYSDPNGSLESEIDKNLEDPVIDSTGSDGIRNRMWAIDDQDIINQIKTQMADKTLLIADGHHRYETALEYKSVTRSNGDQNDDRPADYVMTFLSRAEDKGLIINPTHRVIKNMGDYTLESLLQKLSADFDIVEMGFSEGISDIGRNEISIISRDQSKSHRLRPKQLSGVSYENMGVMQLHSKVLNKVLDEESSGVVYTKYLDEALDLVANRGYELGFLLSSLDANDIFEVVMDDKRMPHKTTYFYPKILSGLVFNPLW